MYEILKAYCEAQDYEFTYARRDFQNLFEAIEEKNKPYFFLDPVEITDNDNDMNVTESKSHASSFMIAFSSDIDEEDYEARFEKYIKPILTEHVVSVKAAIRCAGEVDFVLWKTIEVVNAFDYNFDGLIVTFNIKIDE